MAFFRGEEGSVSFDNGTGSVGAIASTTAWTLDTTKDTLECTAHGDTSRKYVGSLISGSGTVDLLYTATSGDNTAEIIIAKHNIDSEPNTPTKYGVRGRWRPNLLDWGDQF